MTKRFVVPSTESVADMLSMLYGNDVDATEMPDKTIAGAFAASFVCDDGDLVAVCVCDPAFVAYSGAVLSMMPVGGAEDMLESGEFTKTSVDNFYEVINVCSRLLMSDSSAHLKLDKVYRPEDAVAVVGGFSARVTVGFKLKIPRYGVGKMIFSIV
tara:strand:- start:392 stop:859 length:468 start_codon:yes stop_codon:yes gene_type:complete